MEVRKDKMKITDLDKPVRIGFKKLKCKSCGVVITWQSYRGNDRCKDCQLVRVRNYENGLDYWLDKGLIKKLPNYIRPILYEHTK